MERMNGLRRQKSQVFKPILVAGDNFLKSLTRCEVVLVNWKFTIQYTYPSSHILTHFITLYMVVGVIL
jgi:hypothetical protein